MSEDFEAFYEGRAGQTLDPLVLSEDGKGIVMRREDLREGTKRAAERDSHKLETRLSPGEKRNRKRMATVAAVYSIEREVRTSESDWCRLSVGVGDGDAVTWVSVSVFEEKARALAGLAKGASW